MKKILAVLISVPLAISAAFLLIFVLVHELLYKILSFVDEILFIVEQDIIFSMDLFYNKLDKWRNIPDED